MHEFGDDPAIPGDLHILPLFDKVEQGTECSFGLHGTDAAHLLLLQNRYMNKDSEPAVPRQLPVPETMPHIRPATAADLPFIHGLAARLAGAADLPWRSDEEVMRFQRRFMHETLEAPKPGAVTLIAADDAGERQGFVHAEPMLDIFTDQVAAYIPLLAVTEAAEGQGTAKALMAAVEDWARGHGYASLSLDVFASNARGRAFYDRLGYGEETLRLVKDIR